jgi:hypothetical protein
VILVKIKNYIQLLIVVLSLSNSFLYSQNSDSLNNNKTQKFNYSNIIQIRVSIGEGLSRIEAEYKYLWLSFLSTDIIAGTSLNEQYQGGEIGLSLQPLQWIFVQATSGFASWKELATDEPNFSPDYTLGIRGGLIFHIGKLKNHLIFSLSGGIISLIDNDYCIGCGFVRGNVPKSYRVEKRNFSSFSLGFGVWF